MVAVVQDFVQSIESHLFQRDQTILVGDALTVADIVVALVLAESLVVLRGAATAVVVVPQQVYRWIMTVLHTLSDCLPATAAHTETQTVLQGYIQSIAEGTSSPLEKPVTAVTQATTASAATAVPVQKTEMPSQAPTAVPEGVRPATTSTTATTAAADDSTTTTTTTGPTKASESTSSGGGDVQILKLLQEFDIAYSVYDHVPCTTADELVANVPLPNPHVETHTKNLFLRDKKHGLFLVTTATSSAVNTKDLASQLKLPGKSNLRLAEASVLDETLHVRPGTVGPLCLGLAERNPGNAEKMTFVLDQSLLQYETVHSHPARNDQSVRLTPVALQSYFTKLNIQPVLIDFAPTTTSTTTGSGSAVLAGKAPANRPPATKQKQQQQHHVSSTGTTPEHDDRSAVVVAAAAAGKKETTHKVDKKTAKKGETLLALQWKKEENFAQWYTDVIVLSEMISYYDISGCYILRPWSYKIWELIQAWFNGEILKMGVENTYFPLFVSQDRLEKEKDHVEGFAPEVAWVTKSGDGDLARPIAIRPTSETIMYPAYSDWIKSHRDLPLKLNQWNNVVRWEFKYPTPFLRTREFLWQEGHTAHATFEDADATVMAALELYRQVYEDLLAVPVVPGYKTEKEKFAGGFRTTTVEAYVAGSGRAIQGATSHNLGQNFGTMFDIRFQDEKGVSQIVWQTSWGLTTRTIGVMVMVHGDDTGLVLPPKVAPLQVVIVPIVSKKLTHAEADPYCLGILDSLQSVNIRAKYDDRSSYNPGWKYNHWEQKGVPIRIEVGPRDIEQKCARIVLRYNGHKEDLAVDDKLGELMLSKLSEIQSAMFVKAKEARDEHIVQVTEWKDFVPNLEKNNMVLTPWCGGEHQEWEEWVKTKSREESLQARGVEEEDEKTSTSVAAKTLCIPFQQPEMPAGTKCIASGLEATCWVLWGRSY